MKKIIPLLAGLIFSISMSAQPPACNTWLWTQGTPQSVKVGDLDVGGTQITVEANFNCTAFARADQQADIVSKHSNTTDINYVLRTNLAGITTTNGQFLTPIVCTTFANKTYHVAMVYDGVTLSFYRNGFLLSQVAATGNLITNNLQTTIGDYAVNNPVGTNFLGYINEVRIWNVARNQAQIQAFMYTSLPNPTTQANLLGYYRFDNLLNKQGNATFNGTLNGGAQINQTNPQCTFIADGCCTANATNNVTKCSNQNIVLNARSGTTYSWSPATGLSSTTVQSPTCSATSNITYTVTVFNATSNCTNNDVFNVTVNLAPISNMQDTSICKGDTIQLIAGLGNTYLWSPNYNISNINIRDPLVWPAVTTDYIVTITNANGCSMNDTVRVTVNDCGCEDSCNWSLTGNSNVKLPYFIGSKNNADFKIRTNNTQRMVISAAGNVGINTLSPAKLLEVNGEARIGSLPSSAVTDRIVFANASGDLRSLSPTGNTNQYLSGNGTWQNITGGGINSAGQGLTIDLNTVLLGDRCNAGGGQFAESREVNMNNSNLYFNSASEGKLYMGTTQNGSQECRNLYSRLEISTQGLTSAANDYSSPNPSTSGLRFTDLTARTEPIENRFKGVLSLDEDGDVIWVNSCCEKGTEEPQLSNILARLSKLENEVKESKAQTAILKEQFAQMDVILSKANTIVLNQNVPNPFAESTVITYSIPKSFSNAQIIFRTINGEIIKTAEIKTAGKGQINVFANDISSGIYTYTLVIDGKQIDSKKMVKQ